MLLAKWADPDLVGWSESYWATSAALAWVPPVNISLHAGAMQKSDHSQDLTEHADRAETTL